MFYNLDDYLKINDEAEQGINTVKTQIIILSSKIIQIGNTSVSRGFLIVQVETYFEQFDVLNITLQQNICQPTLFQRYIISVTS